MPLRQFSAGFTHTLYFNFWDNSGARTSVDLPTVDILTPQKTKFVNQAALTTTSVIGQYSHSFFLPVGTTVGHWFARAIGLTTSDTLYSESQVFEIIDYKYEPLWVGLQDLREFLSLTDDDHTDDVNLRSCLQSAIELVEGYTRRNYGISQFDEIIEIKNTDRVSLKHFPINSIVGMTATVKVIPRDTMNLLTETVTDTQVSFYYRLDSTNGILYLTDSAGFDDYYENVLLGISYLAGFATIPESVRYAVLSLASAIHNLSCTQGLDEVKFADVSFSTSKQLLDGPIGDMLRPFINNCQV